MIKVEFNKLVRNRLGKILKDHKVTVNSTLLTQAQFIEKLKDKIIEEAKEVQEAENIQDLIIELADLFEVMHTLARACAIDWQQVEEAKYRKKEEIGYFNKENYIDNILVEENNTEVIDYLRNNGKLKSSNTN